VAITITKYGMTVDARNANSALCVKALLEDAIKVLSNVDDLTYPLVITITKNKNAMAWSTETGGDKDGNPGR